MPDLQSFRSEAYKNGHRYPFEARFDESLWTATIRDEAGHRRGVISCTPHLPTLRGEALEDAVCDWVHRAVENSVGFSDEKPLSDTDALGAWVFTSALQVELDRARAVRAELALTMTRFTAVYDAYREQQTATTQRRSMTRLREEAADETVFVRGAACVKHPH